MSESQVCGCECVCEDECCIACDKVKDCDKKCGVVSPLKPSDYT